MADEDASLKVEVLPEFEKFQADLAKMPGWTEDAARKSSAAMQRGYYKKMAAENANLEALTKKTAENSGKAWGDVGKKIGELVGGPFSKLSNVIFDLGPKSSGAMGVLGAGLGAAAGAAVATAAALTGVVVVAKSLADAALVARDNLIKAGRAAEIPPESLASLKNYQSNAENLGLVFDDLKVTVGSFVADDLATLSYSLGQIAEKFHTVTNSGWGFRDTLFAIGKMSPLGFIAKAAEDYANAQDEAALAAGRALEAEKRLRAENERRIDAMQREVEAGDQLRKNQVKLAEQTLERQRQAAKQASEERAQLAQQEHDQDLAQLEAYEAEAYKTEMEARQKMAADQIKLEADVAKTVAQIQKEGAALTKRLMDDEMTRRKQNTLLIFDSYASIRNSALSTADTILSAEIENYSKRGKEGKAYAQRLAIAQRGLALFGIGVNTGEAVVKAFAMFGPPPSPVGIAAAGAAGAAGIAQAAIVATQPLPSFFSGTGRTPGSRGEGTPVMHHGGERTVTSAAADTWGDQFIDAINAGLQPLQALGGQSGQGDLILDGRVMGRYVRKEANRGKPVGYASPYSGRR